MYTGVICTGFDAVIQCTLLSFILGVLVGVLHSPGYEHVREGVHLPRSERGGTEPVAPQYSATTTRNCTVLHCPKCVVRCDAMSR